MVSLIGAFWLMYVQIYRLLLQKYTSEEQSNRSEATNSSWKVRDSLRIVVLRWITLSAPQILNINTLSHSTDYCFKLRPETRRRQRGGSTSKKQYFQSSCAFFHVSLRTARTLCSAHSRGTTLRDQLNLHHFIRGLI